MTSPKQIAANRENAKHSTGPRSLEGKAQSSQNAVAHGLAAKKYAVSAGDVRKLEYLIDGLTAEFEPETVFASDLVEKLAIALVRLDRVPQLEAAIHDVERLEQVVAEHPAKRREIDRFAVIAAHWGLRAEDFKEGGRADTPEKRKAVNAELAAEEARAFEEKETARLAAISDDDKEELARAEAALALGKRLLREHGILDAINKLGRYQSAQWSFVERIIRMLHQLRALRQQRFGKDLEIVDLKNGGA